MKSSDVDKRKYERKTYSAAVDLTVNNFQYIVQLKDLSLGGAFIVGDHLLPIEEEMHVSLDIPFENKPGSARLKGTVRRKTESGIGIEFF